MLDLLRRLFGLQRAGDAPPGTVATVTIQGRGGGSPASAPALLVARNDAGASLLACRVEVGTSRDPSARPYGTGASDFPEGDYEVESVSPAAADEAGAGSLGPHPVLRLRARVGEAAPPPLHGRANLLVHGGFADPPADGCIRMDDADLARLLALLPGELGRVLVRVFRPAEQDDAWDPDAGTPGRDRWFGDASADDNGGERAGLAPDPASPDPSADTTGAAGDQAAALALADLGFGVLSDQATPATEAPGAATADVSAAAVDWTPAGGEYGR